MMVRTQERPLRQLVRNPEIADYDREVGSSLHANPYRGRPILECNLKIRIYVREREEARCYIRQRVKLRA
jgi:hypothetical protein